MPTTKVCGCGGRDSVLNFFPCSFCLLKTHEQECKHILKIGRTTKHMEYYSDTEYIIGIDFAEDVDASKYIIKAKAGLNGRKV